MKFRPWPPCPAAWTSYGMYFSAPRKPKTRDVLVSSGMGEHGLGEGQRGRSEQYLIPALPLSLLREIYLMICYDQFPAAAGGSVPRPSAFLEGGLFRDPADALNTSVTTSIKAYAQHT